MQNIRIALLAVVLLANISIIAGTLIFEWSPLTVAVLFVIDALLAVIRTMVEWALAGRPPGDDVHRPTHPHDFTMWYRHTINKRGYYQWPTPSLKIYPRNITYILKFLIGLTVTGAFATMVWYSSDLSVSGLEASLVLLLPLFVAKHAAIVAVWTADGIYEQASIATVRPRGLMLSGLIGGIAVLMIVPQPPHLVASAATLVMIPKLLVDLREAGIGPAVLTFDPRSTTPTEPLTLPVGTPQHVFRTDNRALRSWALLHITPLYTIFPGSMVFVLLAAGTDPLVDAGGLSSTLHGVLVLLATVSVIFCVSYLVLWMGHDGVEYRLYHDTLIAYDAHLEAVQWIVPCADIRSISIEETFVTLQPPFVNAPVYIEHSHGEPLRMMFLRDPHELAFVVGNRVG